MEGVLMSRVIVHIKTDHADSDKAARSVSNALKRAGYDIEAIQVAGDSITPQQVYGNIQVYAEYADPVFITALEPEVWDEEDD